MTGALVRIEARHLARSPLLLMGVALGVAAGRWSCPGTCPPSPATT